MPKYNLALVPVSNSSEAVLYANLFSRIADTYILGKDSLPHVTLYQFEAEESAIEDIWERVMNIWRNEHIELEFKEFSCISKCGSQFWVSLLPSRRDEVHAMHRIIAEILGMPIKDKFDPHMTLFNTTYKGYQEDVELIKDSCRQISDSFVLSLGYCDDVGQLTKVIFQCKKKN